MRRSFGLLGGRELRFAVSATGKKRSPAVMAAAGRIAWKGQALSLAVSQSKQSNQSAAP
jgi:hypothetical protein